MRGVEEMDAKERIIELFRQNVKGKRPDVSFANERHDGKAGHWLERQFGIVANADNEADLWGFELKNETSSGKTTFGDWSANEYVFTNPRYAGLFVGRTKSEKKDSFVRIFGRPNYQKGGRYSWSGSPCPKIGYFNDYGQILAIQENLDIVALYSFSKDKRVDKFSIVPPQLQQDIIVLAHWYGLARYGIGGKCLQMKLEDKFNDKGWFTCKTDFSGRYDRICFGAPMNYQEWIKLVNSGIVYFDSGMYEGNPRPYSQWRADNNLWDSLIYEEYY